MSQKRHRILLYPESGSATLVETIFSDSVRYGS
jgi:hypothetical protein